MAAALLAAGCGSSKSSQPPTTADWANGVCSAVTTYTKSLKDAAQTLTGNVSKAGLQDAADSVKSATDTFVSDTKSLGKPNTNAGQQAKQTLDTLSSQLKTGESTIEDAAGTGLLQGAAAVTAALATAQTQVTTAFNELKGLDAKGELSQAFSQASSCSSLTSS